MSLYERGVELLGKLLKDEEELSQFIQENSGRLQEITGVPLKQREGEPSIYTSATGKRFLLQLYVDQLSKNLGDHPPNKALH